MKEDLIIVEAKILLLSTEEGGRQTGIFSRYRPNHFFEEFENSPGSYIGEIRFSDKEILLPGESVIGTVIFLNGGKIEEYISVGREWYIHEGSRRVGYGKILEIKLYDPLIMSK